VCVPRVYGGEITDFTTLQVVPWGIFSNHTVARKDKWVREYVGKVTARRVAVEAANGKVPGLRESSESLRQREAPCRAKLNPPPSSYPLPAVEWEGMVDKILLHFTKNKNCETAFQNYMCFMNFPRCDEAENSLIMCRSSCENFFKACDYPKDLWRCGPFEYFGGDAPEVVSASQYNAKTGAPIYTRAWWPGSPFRDGIADAAVCTPGTVSGALPLAALPVVEIFLAVVATLYLCHYAAV